MNPSTQTRFPIHLEMRGDDFTFDIEISLEMAGHIIQYVGNCRDAIAKQAGNL